MKPKRVYSAVKTCLEFGFVEQNSNGLFIGLYCAFVSESRSLFAALDDDKSAERSNGGGWTPYSHARAHISTFQRRTNTAGQVLECAVEQRGDWLDGTRFDPPNRLVTNGHAG